MKGNSGFQNRLTPPPPFFGSLHKRAAALQKRMIVEQYVAILNYLWETQFRPAAIGSLRSMDDGYSEFGSKYDVRLVSCPFI